MEAIEVKPETKKQIKKSLNQSPKKDETAEIKHRYIYMRSNAEDATANLIDELLMKCNKKAHGANVDFSMLLSFALKKISDSDIVEIQNNSLSDEDRANEELRKFNIKHGTNYSLFEFVLNGLQKKSKKGVVS